MSLVVGLGDFFEVLLLVDGPVVVGEDFDFVWAGEAGLLDPGFDLLEWDAAFAHEAAVVEEVGGGGFPVADVVGVEAVFLCGELDLGL